MRDAYFFGSDELEFGFMPIFCGAYGWGAVGDPSDLWPEL